MAMLKRHLGSRVGVGVVVTALMLIFTAAPALAAVPTITSFTPTSGPAANCRITITGTGFTLPNVTVVHFTGANAPLVAGDIVSNTQINVTVPAGATDGTITVQNTDGTSPASATSFDVGATGCAPTVTSFTPTSGPVGGAVTILGTNLLNATSVTFNGTATSATVVPSSSASSSQVTATVPAGATTGPIRVLTPVATSAPSATNFTVLPAPTITSFSPTFGPIGRTVTITGTNFSGTGFTTTAVRFNNIAATTFTVNSATQITATVPTGATTGKITVTTQGGTATSSTNFVVSTLHPRTVTLQLRRHIIARGDVSAGGFAACEGAVEVKIQRRTSGHWRTVGTDTTSTDGSYSVHVRDTEGRYRAKAPRVVLSSGADVCSPSASPSRRHTH